VGGVALKSRQGPWPAQLVIGGPLRPGPDALHHGLSRHRAHRFVVGVEGEHQALAVELVGQHGQIEVEDQGVVGVAGRLDGARVTCSQAPGTEAVAQRRLEGALYSRLQIYSSALGTGHQEAGQSDQDRTTVEHERSQFGQCPQSL